jgi:hypothetical protein
MKWDQLKDASLFVFTTTERVAIRKILREFPRAAEALETGMRPVLEMLVRTCRGLPQSEDEADYILAGLADRVVGRTISETGDWGEVDDIRTAAIDLLTRHLLAGMRDDFLQRVLVRREDQASRGSGSTTRDRPHG